MISIFIIHLAKYDLVMYGEQKNDQISCINVLLDDLASNFFFIMGLMILKLSEISLSMETTKLFAINSPSGLFLSLVHRCYLSYTPCLHRVLPFFNWCLPMYLCVCLLKKRRKKKREKKKKLILHLVPRHGFNKFQEKRKSQIQGHNMIYQVK